MKRFLIIKPSSLGDVLHAFPAANALADSFPGCEVDWLIHPAFTELLDYLPFVKRKILFERKKLGKIASFPFEFPKLFSALRKEKYDAVFDLQGLLRSGILSFCARTPLRYGLEFPREPAAGLFYNRKMTYPAGTLHAVDRLCHMISSVDGIARPERYYLLPVLENYRRSALAKAASEGADLSCRCRVVAVAPGARWASKTWETPFFAEIMKKISERYPETVFLILGSASEGIAAEELQQLLPEQHLTDLCGKTSIGELVELIRLSGCLLCNDSGPMHIAAFTGTPPVAFFGPTDPELTGPCCRKQAVFQAKGLPCIKCMHKVCSDMKCHTALSSAEAAEAVISFLNRSSVL